MGSEALRALNGRNIQWKQVFCVSGLQFLFWLLISNLGIAQHHQHTTLPRLNGTGVKLLWCIQRVTAQQNMY